MAESKKTAALIIGVCTGISGVIGALANSVQILEFLGISPNQKTADTDSSVVQSAETLQNDIQSVPETELLTESETDLPIEETLQINLPPETELQSESETTLPPAESSALWKVTPLFPISGYIMEEEQNLLQYDSVNRKLYYYDRSELVILCYDFNSQSTEHVLEGYVKCLIVGQPYGKAFAYDSTYETLYDLITGETINCYLPGSQGNYMISESEILSPSSIQTSQVISIESGQVLSSGQIPRSTTEWAPFLADDCYYYWSRIGYAGDVVYIDQTVQLLTADGSYQPIKEYQSDAIIAWHVAQDAVYYITKDRSIYQVNLEPASEEEKIRTGTIIVNGDAPGNTSDSAMSNDILMINGADIQNTATSYLSNDIKEFVKISDSCFAVYDGTDKTVKLIGELS